MFLTLGMFASSTKETSTLDCGKSSFDLTSSGTSLLIGRSTNNRSVDTSNINGTSVVQASTSEGKTVVNLCRWKIRWSWIRIRLSIDKFTKYAFTKDQLDVVSTFRNPKS